MGRKEIILEHLKKETLLFLENQESIRTDAQTISKQIDIARYNVSRELNNLVEENQAIKINGRPVYFLSKLEIEQYLERELQTNQLDSLEELTLMLEDEPHRVQSVSEDFPFSELIGYDGSLSNAVKQAKAALLYPPHGLHTLITGPSGSGKTTFASFMYQYALHAQTIKQEAPFIIFNCADYSNNQHLLLDQLFGHKKNAFTGAYEDKKGIVEEADEGILFLDEIHRLPAEGQEMLFSIIDRGEFYRLGETGSPRKVNILIIGATTEDIHGTILTTFLRRIPLVIAMPSVHERGLSEKIQLIHFSFAQESKKIGKELVVSEDVIRFFLQYEAVGNIGQLRNDIQLLCANALVDSISKKESVISIKLSHLSSYLIDQFYFSRNDSLTGNEVREKLKLLQITDFHFYPDSEPNFNPFILVEQSNLSNDILNMYEKHLNKEEDLSSLKEMIQRKVAQLSTASSQQRQPFFKIISRKNYETIIGILNKVSVIENYHLDEANIKGLALHLDTLIEKISEGYSFKEDLFSSQNMSGKNELEKEMKIAKFIYNEISGQLNIQLPESEVYFISLYLKAMNDRYSEKRIGVLILMHGEQAASDLAKTANDILDVSHAVGLNMPLTQSVNDTLEKATQMIKELDQGKGVIVLSDMGSLNLFGDIITKKTGIPTKTIKMVTTPMAIEANRKALLPQMTLEKLTIDIIEQSSYIGNSVVEIQQNEQPSIEINDRKEKIIFILSENLNFLDASIVYDLLEKQTMLINERFEIENYDAFWIKYLFHVSSLLERAIRKEPFGRENTEEVITNNKEIYLFLKAIFSPLENRFAVEISDSELSYVIELIGVSCTLSAH